MCYIRNSSKFELFFILGKILMKGLEILTLYRNAVDVYEDLMSNLCEKYNISIAGFEILYYAYNNSNEITSSDIALWRGLKANLVSLHIKNLVNSGHLRKEVVENDRRKLKLVCTSLVEPIIKEGEVIIKKYIDGVLNGVSKNELEIYDKCLKTFAINILDMKLNGEKGAKKE